MREAREGKHAPRTDAARGVHRRSPRGLRLEGPRRLDKDRAVVVTAEVQRLEGGQLAETTRIVLDRISEQAAKHPDQIVVESCEPTLTNDLRRARRDQPGTGPDRLAQRRVRLGR